jgi:hypothetical protein
MKKYSIILLLTLFLFSFKHDVNEEGMFPMSHLSKLDLKKAGLEIPVQEIYNESRPSLVNALVRLGGCTGSFISDKGLIITNHHCVFSSVAAASTPESNYLENGFYAKTNSAEIKTTLPCKITQSYSDVSNEVLLGLDLTTNALDKQKKIKQNIDALVKAEKEKFPTLDIEISEMLVGKSYTLFRYKTLTDVRLVYVPPKELGKFGGETDNWEWPRHNGDFSVVRAYENGLPYTPEKYLEVNPGGTNEGDFTFILGYPGRTYRNETAQFLDYQNNYVLPIISDWFDFKIKAIEDYAGSDVAMQLAYSGTLASLSNVTKNFKGKMQGLQRTDVIEQTYKNQNYLMEYAETNPELAKYVPLFKKNDDLYKRKFALSRDYLYLNQLYSTGIFAAGAYTYMYKEKLAELDKKKQKEYLDSNKASIENSFGTYFSVGNNEALDKTLFIELYYQLSKTNIAELQKAFNPDNLKSKEAIYAKATALWESTKLNKSADGAYLLREKPTKFFANNDAMVVFAGNVNSVFRAIQTEINQINAELDEIIPRFNDLEMEVNGGNFIPDANGTLRFTYGYVKGYEPQDAIEFSPYTTTKGILEKSQGTDNLDYILRQDFIDKIKQIQPADILKLKEQNAVVVAFLYNMDTTGGNSGSPIMDSKGRLVGVNFDRAYTATINDYAWNESYSRSIGVDIRYVLYIMKYFGEADEVLEEMGVTL